MRAREITGEVIRIEWRTPTVFSVFFRPSRKFFFLPGQFLSIYVPTGAKGGFVRRPYSFATPYETAIRDGYELCCKKVPNGLGTTFLSSLKPGDEFRATAPYGELIFEPHEPPRQACFICTGTGIAPFRAMILSKEFIESQPDQTLVVFGAKTKDEILYKGELEARQGITVVNCLSQEPRHAPPPNRSTYLGRVTDYLKTLPVEWPWHQTEYFICGNTAMVQEALDFLTGAKGVSAKKIHYEMFSGAQEFQKISNAD